MWVTFSRICKQVYCSVFLDNQYNDYLKTPIFVLQSNMEVNGSICKCALVHKYLNIALS